MWDARRDGRTRPVCHHGHGLRHPNAGHRSHHRDDRRHRHRPDGRRSHRRHHRDDRRHQDDRRHRRRHHQDDRRRHRHRHHQDDRGHRRRHRGHRSRAADATACSSGSDAGLRHHRAEAACHRGSDGDHRRRGRRDDPRPDAAAHRPRGHRAARWAGRCAGPPGGHCAARDRRDAGRAWPTPYRCWSRRTGCCPDADGHRDAGPARPDAARRRDHWGHRCAVLAWPPDPDGLRPARDAGPAWARRTDPTDLTEPVEPVEPAPQQPRRPAAARRDAVPAGAEPAAGRAWVPRAPAADRDAAAREAPPP